MDKTILEKRIAERAEKRLRDEYDHLRKVLKDSKFILTGFNVENKILVGGSNSVFPEYIHHINAESDLGKGLESRRQELIREETDAILNKLSSISHLFEHHGV